MVPLDGSEPNPAPFGHDKPSNSLFIPPEFRAVNCQVCKSFVFDVDLDVTPAGEYCSTTYAADVDGFCFNALPEDTTILLDQHPWSHSTSFGDGSWAYATTYSGVVSGSHKYTEADRYTMTHYVNCACPSAFTFGGSDSESFNVPGGILSCRPTVKVDSANIVRDEIFVTMRPFTASGTLVVELVGSRTHRISTTAESGGTRRISFNAASLPTGAYTGVRATWTVGTNKPNDTKAYSFEVLGIYRHSQYNTPTESACIGGQSPAYIARIVSHDPKTNEANCSFPPTTMKSDFVYQANLNGSGISLNHGTVEYEVTCRGKSNFPPDGSDKTFRGHSSVRSHCGTELGNNTIAVNLEGTDLACGDRLYILDVGVKTVTDRCPGCTATQIDNYTTTPACRKGDVLGLGDFTTIKL